MRFIVGIGLVSGLLLATSTAHADGDAKAGEKVFRKCKACHVVEEPKNKVGPHLDQLFGRQPGSLEDFKYSPAMVEFGQDKVWDEDLLAEYLANPKKVVEKTKMAFVGLKKEQDIADVIAYLKQFSDTAPEKAEGSEATEEEKTE